MTPRNDAGEVLYILTCKTIRTMLNVFLVLFRAIEIAMNAVPLPVTAEDNSHLLSAHGAGTSVPARFVERVANMIKIYHVEASLDQFNVMQQLFFLAPGQRLVYRHNFAGMFNDISQVVYFHYPDYVRAPQVSIDVMQNNAMNSLPCLMNIIPQLRVMYDDEPWLPFGLLDSSEWLWIVSVRRVYLWDGNQNRLLASTGNGIMDLAAYYLLCKSGVEYFTAHDKDGSGGDDNNAGSYSNVKMTDFSHARIVKRFDFVLAYYMGCDVFFMVCDV